MRQLETTIEIEATPARVWQELTDFASYSEWNPFITEAAGEAKEGSRLEMRFHPPGGSSMRMKPTVITTDEGRELRWLGHLLVRGVFDGEHYFLLEDLGDGRTKLVHGERFSGVTVPLFAGVLKKSEKGFGMFNQALKERSENQP